MDQTTLSTATVPAANIIRAGQATILALYDEMVDAAANVSALFLPRQPQLCYCYVAPAIERHGNHLWVGL